MEDYDAEFQDEELSEELTEEQIRELVQIGPPILTRFEKARILGTRALQVSQGAPVLTFFEEEQDLSDPLLIAMKELEEKVLPISVRRFLPDGRFQDIPIQFLKLSWTKRQVGQIVH